MAIPDRLPNGYALQDGYTLENLMATPQWQTNYGITALAGGGLSSSTPVLVNGVNVVTVVGTAADSVVLPSAVAGTIVYLLNADSADAVQVFAQGSDTINGTAGATGVSYAAAKRVLFIAVTNNVWIANVMSAT